MDHFYSDRYAFSIPDINISLIILKNKSILKTIYRLLDDGNKIDRDFFNLNDIPEEVSTTWGDKISIEDVVIVPFYALDQKSNF